MKQDCAVVEIDGKHLEFSYGYNALCDAEDACGCNLQDALDRLVGAGPMSATQFRGLIYAMICAPRDFPKEPKDQLKYCGNLVRPDTMVPLREGLQEACTIAISEEYHQKYLEVLRRAKEAADVAAAKELMMDADEEPSALDEDPAATALREANSAVLS